MMVVTGTPLMIGLTVVVATTGILIWLYSRRAARSGPKQLLQDSSVKHALKLIEKRHLSHNARLFRFQLPPDTCLGLQPGQHVYLSAIINGSLVVRPYSPVSKIQEVGHMDLIIKVYFKGVHPSFPNGGKMSQFLNQLNLGDSIHVRGPAGRMVYEMSSGRFVIREEKTRLSKTVNASQINMIAGGSGITPMLQMLNALFMGGNEAQAVSSQVSLIYANQTEDDILCRSYLEEIAKQNPGKLEIWYTLTQPPLDWKYGIGRVNEDMFKAHLFPPSSEGIQLLCGPAGMINSTTLPLLHQMGFEPSRCFVY